jgi:hypothetical protein
MHLCRSDDMGGVCTWVEVGVQPRDHRRTVDHEQLHLTAQRRAQQRGANRIIDTITLQGL